MVETLQNKMLENQEVVAGDYPGIELVEEYRSLEKPKFDWNPKDNLIACIQFSPYQPFPERLFQAFIVERQAEAFSETIEVEIPQVVEEEKEIAKNELIEEPQQDDEELPSYLEDTWVTPMQERPKEIKLIRYIWNSGILIEGGENSGKYRVSVERNSDTRQILIECSAKSQDAKKYFQSLVDRLSVNTTPDVFTICTCSLCQKKGVHRAHWIRIGDLENLKTDSSRRFNATEAAE